jgi:hypothetical protein
MPVDLTSFNGIDSTERTKSTAITITATNGAGGFLARQRGSNPPPAPTLVNNLWLQEPLNDDSKQPNGANEPLNGSFVYDTKLGHTFGYLNSTYGAPNSTGDPSTQPFPWFTWNNRPFISQIELANVPWASSSQLLSYSYGTITTTGAPADPYTTNSTAALFPRLINTLSTGTVTATGATTGGTQFHRVFDLVGVPSRFVGTDIQIDPASAAATSGTHTFHTPFNRIPTYREPGKINLNTIYDENVLNGLVGGNATGVSWTDFRNSRRGYASAGTSSIADLDVTYPTQFAHPFRGFGSANLVPLDYLKPKRKHEINATLLREKETTTTPLFQTTGGTGTWNDPSRNPFFYYQGMQRLQNLTTTRSNVYAVWITVGYFEVEPAAKTHPTWTPAQINAAFPDGYTLGQELGADTGETERHRAFYMIDRTIPVGFQRGKDLNVENAILVKRFIE